MARTVVTFASQVFNTSEPRPGYVNPGCYGDDVTRWLAAEMKKIGVPTEDPHQEDFGWYLPYRLGDQTFDFIVSYRPDESPSVWIGWIEREASTLSSLLGGRNRNIPDEAAKAIHRILESNPGIREIRWHQWKDFYKGREELGTPAP